MFGLLFESSASLNTELHYLEDLRIIRIINILNWLTGKKIKPEAFKYRILFIHKLKNNNK